MSKLRRNNQYPITAGSLFSSKIFLGACVLSALYILLTVFSYANLSTPGDDRGLFARNNPQHYLNGPPKVDTKTLNDFLSKEKNRFPIQMDKNDFETIKHPGPNGGEDLEMRVPKFWAPEGGRESLTGEDGIMTRSQALSVGSKIRPVRVVPRPLDNSEKDPFDEYGLLETIYVAISSYRDWQCPHTVESIFKRARYPERVRVAVIDQIAEAEDTPCGVLIESCESNPEEGLCKFKNQVDVYQMDASLAMGPVFARHIGHRLYRGEYFAAQVDAHVTFVTDWDVDIIDQFRSTANEMAVLSTYLSDVQGSIDEVTGKSLRNSRPIMCNTEFEGSGLRKYLRNEQQPEAEPAIKGSPQLQPYWAAGFSFSRGHFVVNVPYDQYLPMIFQGEEIEIGLRGFTYGYDIYAPEYSVCFHMYAVGKNEAARKKVNLFWENSDSYVGVEGHAMDRLLGVIKMNPDVDSKKWNHADEDFYGLGKVRDVSKFFETFGIDIKNRKTEQHLCSFVLKKMHVDFVEHLRPNGMGIDYSKIHYKFKTPRKG
mmetsp:Transcript_39854/g.58544  ORF Transcript_39854/g.58544 Transcript_39854/m.58544 type:complete len:539 (-) Transcript_39854:346-1962(-)